MAIYMAFLAITYILSGKRIIWVYNDSKRLYQNCGENSKKIINLIITD